MNKVEIHVPNKQYNGVVGDIRFHNGVAQVEDVKKAKMLAERFGFEVKEIKSDQIAAEAIEEVQEEKPKRKPRKKSAKAGE